MIHDLDVEQSDNEYRNMMVLLGFDICFMAFSLQCVSAQGSMLAVKRDFWPESPASPFTVGREEIVEKCILTVHWSCFS